MKKQRSFLRPALIVISIVLLVVVVLWIGWRYFNRQIHLRAPANGESVPGFTYP